MDILGRSILILGGYGLVGQAVARRLLQEGPRRLTLLSLRREEAEEAVRLVAPEAQGTSIDAAWGDVFAFSDWKDRPRREVFSEAPNRARLIESLLEPLDEEALAEYYLYRLITGERPDFIVDCVNTATGIAYQDIYKTSREAWLAARAGTFATASRRSSSPTTSRS